jgi:hypothetical protein
MVNNRIPVRKQSYFKKKTYLSSLEQIIKSLSNSLDINDNKSASMEVDVNMNDNTNDDIIELSPTWLEDMKKAIKANNINNVINLLNNSFGDVQPIPDIELFNMLGQYGTPEIYTLFRNSNVFEDYIDKSIYVETIIEGLSFSDNNELLIHLTNTHQLTHINEYQLVLFINALMDNKAYNSLNSLCNYIRSKNTKESSLLIKQCLTRSLETLDGRIITVILNCIKTNHRCIE